MRWQLRQYRNFRARHGYGANWREAAAQTLISACQHREPQNLFRFIITTSSAACYGMFYNVIRCSGAFATPWMVPCVACVNADISRDLWDQGDKPVPPLRQLSGVIYVVTACGIWRAMLSGVAMSVARNLWRVADAPHIVPVTPLSARRYNG